MRFACRTRCGYWRAAGVRRLDGQEVAALSNLLLGYSTLSEQRTLQSPHGVEEP
jgi:hypothetical protein